MKTITIDLTAPKLDLPKIEYTKEERDSPKPKAPLEEVDTLPLSAAEAIELREQFIVEMSEIY